MRLLEIELGANALFTDGFTLDFQTVDGVRKNSNYPEFLTPAFKLKTGFYSQVQICLVGLNATGKTSVLEIVSLVLSLLISDNKLSTKANYLILNKLITKMNSTLTLSFKFLLNNKVFRLDSVIKKEERGFVFIDEKLFSISIRKYTFKDTADNFKLVKDRNTEKHIAYLKDDMSIVSAINDCAEVFRTNLIDFNKELSFNTDENAQALIKCLDPSIKELSAHKDNEQRITSAQVQFERRENIDIKECTELKDILSSGTLEGLSLLPQLISVLTKGGYLVIDDLECHLSKKIVDFIMSLFTDNRTNSHGACLVFSTNYPELLDFITRRDNIYLTLRDDKQGLCVKRLSSFKEVSRNDILKSKVILNNIIDGTAPRFKALRDLKDNIINDVNKA